MKKLTRRQMIKTIGLTAAGTLLSSCATPTPVIQEKLVTQVVKETSVVKETVKETQVVEVTAAAPTGPTNALGVTLPADALPLEKQFWSLAVEPTGGGFGHIMESLYNRAYEHAGGYETLTTLNTEMEVIPVGAESWAVSDDGLTWTFKLRKDLVYSDGKPITANDWVFTLQRALSNGYDFGWFYFDIKNASKVYSKELPADQLGIKAVDDYTLQIMTEVPTPYLPGIGTWFGVAPKHAYDDYGENWALDPKKFVSSGPFILTQFERGVQHKWELNKPYKGIRRPYFTEIHEQKLPTGLPAYIAGDIPQYVVGGNTPAGELGLINANPVLRAESHPQPATNTDYIGFNTLPGAFPPLDNPDVRMALCKAIDKETLVSQIFLGLSNPAYGILPKGFPGYTGDALKELDINKFDPEAAKALLSKAGYPDGKGFPKFEMWVRWNNPSQKVQSLAEAMQARWKETLGVNIELRFVEIQSFTQTAFKDQKVPIYWVNYAMDYYDPATFLNVFRDGGRHPTDTKAWTEAYNKANMELDSAKRFTMLAESEKQLVESSAFYFVQSPFDIYLVPCTLGGLKANKDGYVFTGGGGPGTPHAFEGIYWTNAECRKGLK
jgi:oligopeptide transport system substrate-binding protein